MHIRVTRIWNLIRENTVLALVLAGLVFSISACDQVTETVEIPVGVILPLSGTLGVAGQSIMEGMNLALEDINTQMPFRLRFIVEDGKSIIDTALSAYTRLADEHNVPIIIGPATSSETEQAIPLINSRKIATLSPTAARSGLSAQSEFLFLSSLTVDRTIPDGVHISKAYMGYQNVATLVNDQDAFSINSHEILVDELESYDDITIVHAASYSLTQGTEFGDITPQLIAIQNATPTPEAIFLSALPAGRIGALIAAHRLELRIPFIVNFMSIEAIQAVNAVELGAAEGAITFQVWLPNTELEANKNFVDNFISEYGKEPGDFAARGYASVTILGKVMTQISTFDPVSIRDGLSELRDFNSIFGSFSFDANGDAVASPVIAQVRNNMFEVLTE